MTSRPEFYVKYWGVRGSIPAPGPDTARYGGNTTNLELQAGDVCIAIDGGTGVRLYGQSLLPRMPVNVTFLMTHLHWDHVQGFPFFTPFLLPGNKFEIYSWCHNGGTINDVLRQLMAQPAFPISMDAFQSEVSFKRVDPDQVLEFGDLTVRTALLRHPGGVIGYRFEYKGKVFVHCSDWEHPPDGSLDPVLLDLARDADVLSVDATYTEDEYTGKIGPARRGWGHATHEEAARHGRAAGVKEIVLFHHEQGRTDLELDDMCGNGHLAAASDVSVAAEGRVITFL